MEKLNYINENIEDFYWQDSDKEKNSITFGPIDRSHMILKFDNDEATINLTLFEQNGSIKYAPHQFNMLIHKDNYYLIKNIVLKVTALNSNNDFIERQRIYSYELMEKTNSFINKNASVENLFL